MTSRSRGHIGREWLWLNAVAIFAIIGLLAYEAYPSTEAVRLRNALLIAKSEPTDFTWLPDRYPAGFTVEHGPIPPQFQEVVKQTGAQAMQGEFEKSLALAAHLLRNAKDKGPIQSDLFTTYRRIVEDGYGYCADYTDVFLALAHAAKIPARQWGFSFDGFGGHGHAFIEIFDWGRRKWLFLDVYNNFYVVDLHNNPVSALEFRADILDGGRGTRMVPISAARAGFRYPEKALDYYSRGAAEWYLWWGNNVYTYDRHPLVRMAGTFSRSLEQFAAILVGVHPHIRVLETPQNESRLSRMWELRKQLQIALSVLVFLVALMGAQLVVRRRTRSGRR